MRTKIYKKSDKPCKGCLAICRNGIIELHLYSSFRKLHRAALHYLDSGLAIYRYSVLKSGAIWYVEACTHNQPFDVRCSNLTGVIVC